MIDTRFSKSVQFTDQDEFCEVLYPEQFEAFKRVSRSVPCEPLESTPDGHVTNE